MVSNETLSTLGGCMPLDLITQLEKRINDNKSIIKMIKIKLILKIRTLMISILKNMQYIGRIGRLLIYLQMDQS